MWGHFNTIEILNDSKMFDRIDSVLVLNSAVENLKNWRIIDPNDNFHTIAEFCDFEAIEPTKEIIQVVFKNNTS